jgi:hypothetical protein
MATVAGVGLWAAKGVHRMKWEGLNATDTAGSPLAAPQCPDKTIQVYGAFNTGTLSIEGSNDGGTTWATLNDPQGNPLSFTAAGVSVIAENPLLIRPSLAGADTDDIDVVIVSQSGKR